MRMIGAAVMMATIAATAFAQTTQPPGRIVTTTRLVAIFSGLENQLVKAVQHHDSNTLSQLLSEDFEVWTPAPPGHPIPKEDWLQQASPIESQSFHLRQMAVRAVGDDVSIASFVLSENFEAPTKTRDTFVVDVWKRIGGEWKLTDRYASPVASKRVAAPAIDKRPTGKQ